MLTDVRYAFRILAKNPGFAAVAVLSLALGIGANTAIFTLVDYVILRSLPVRAPEQLGVIARNPEKPSPSFNYPDYVYIRDHNQSYSGVIASNGGSNAMAFAVPGEKGTSAEVVAGAHVSGNYFEVLGVGAAIGRVFTPADNQTEGAHPYVILSYDFWQRRFGGDKGVLGRSITLNGARFTIVGAAPRGFHGISVGTSPDLYLPIMMMPTVNPPARGWNTRHWWWLNVTARLKPGATLASATSEANVLWQQILKADPEYKPPALYNKGAEKFNRMVVLGGSGGWSGFRTQFSKPLTVLMIVVGLVLLIACANVANLLLARAAGRQKEIAVRLAIGAGRARLVYQLLIETLVVSVMGGVTGLLFAWWGVRVMMDLLPKRTIPTELNLTPDLRVLGFAFAASLLTGLICGLVPALQSTRPNLVTALKSETAAARRSRFDLRRILVVAQVAISLLLLIGAGLFVRSLSNLQNLDPGFVRESVLLVSVSPQSSGYQGQRLRDYYERLLAKVGCIPGCARRKPRQHHSALRFPMERRCHDTGLPVEARRKAVHRFQLREPAFLRDARDPDHRGTRLPRHRQPGSYPGSETEAGSCRQDQGAARGDHQRDHGEALFLAPTGDRRPPLPRLEIQDGRILRDHRCGERREVLWTSRGQRQHDLCSGVAGWGRSGGRSAYAPPASRSAWWPRSAGRPPPWTLRFRCCRRLRWPTSSTTTSRRSVC